MWARQGEAGPIVELMSEHALCSLLLRGMKTWQHNDIETAIDLILDPEELATSVVKCTIGIVSWESIWAICSGVQ